MREAKQTHSTAVMDIAQPAPVRTPTQQAFEATLRAINAPFYRPFFASRPMTTINGNAESLERVRVIADAAGLYTHFTPALTSLQVWGFDQQRVTFTPAPTAVHIPRGCEGCDQCSAYSRVYECFPRCPDCGEDVCESCRVESTLVKHLEDGEGRRDACMCKRCWQAMCEADYQADCDLETAELHREGE